MEIDKEKLDELMKLEPEKYKNIIEEAKQETMPTNELQIAISLWEGFVTVRFSRQVDQIRMSKKHARDFAHQLLKKAL